MPNYHAAYGIRPRDIRRNDSFKRRRGGLSARQLRRLLDQNPRLKALCESRTLQRFFCG